MEKIEIHDTWESIRLKTITYWLLIFTEIQKITNILFNIFSQQ